MSVSAPGSFLVSWAPKKEPRPVGYVVAYPDVFHAKTAAKGLRKVDRKRTNTVRCYQRIVRVGGVSAVLWFVVVMLKEAPRV